MDREIKTFAARIASRAKKQSFSPEYLREFIGGDMPRWKKKARRAARKYERNYEGVAEVVETQPAYGDSGLNIYIIPARDSDPRQADEALHNLFRWMDED